MAKKEVALKALNQALKLEKEGGEFYLKAAEKTLSEEAQAMFRSLADDERMHAEMVQRQLNALQSGDAYVLLPDLQVPSIDLDQKLFPPDETKIREKIGSNPDVIAVLHTALDNEIQSYDLYREAAKITRDQAGRQMYQWLASAEMSHFNLLMTNYESIAGPTGWS